jgi:hypothetical protein
MFVVAVTLTPTLCPSLVADNTAAQLKLAQKNARQARMDMNEKRKDINANARKQR